MIKKAVDSQLVRELSQLVLEGKIESLTLTLRTTGKGKGKIQAEYALQEPEAEVIPLSDRLHISDVLVGIAIDLDTKQKYSTLVLTKNLETNQYTYIIHKEGS